MQCAEVEVHKIAGGCFVGAQFVAILYMVCPHKSSD